MPLQSIYGYVYNCGCNSGCDLLEHSKVLHIKIMLQKLTIVTTMRTVYCVICWSSAQHHIMSFNRDLIMASTCMCWYDVLNVSLVISTG